MLSLQFYWCLIRLIYFFNLVWSFCLRKLHLLFVILELPLGSKVKFLSVQGTSIRLCRLSSYRLDQKLFDRFNLFLLHVLSWLTIFIVTFMPSEMLKLMQQRLYRYFFKIITYVEQLYIGRTLWWVLNRTNQHEKLLFSLLHIFSVLLLVSLCRLTFLF